MAQKKKPQPKDKYEARHLRNLSAYEKQIDKIYEEAVKEAASLSTLVGGISGDKAFSFADYPITRQRLERLLSGLKNSVYASIVNGVRSEWTLANNKNNELCNQVFGANVDNLSEAQYRRYYSTNEKAREAFITRKLNGMNLSDRVWNYTNQFKEEIEMGLDVGLRQGLSAADMARDLKQYLKYPDKLFRRVRDEHGELQLSKPAAAFHPGRGVYRSSYKNARRLAATETNIAYRTADYTRYQDLDFVVGIEVHLSNNHTLNGEPFEDICDQLAGRYPKDFKFTGWHPLCRCHTTSVLKTREELFADNERIMRGEPVSTDSVNSVNDVPENFIAWIDDNRERAKGWSSLPYFAKDNPQYTEDFYANIYTQEEKKFTIARRTAPAMTEVISREISKLFPNMSAPEQAAIFEYTRGDISDFRQLNNQLRKGQELSEYNKAFSGLLSSALSKIPTEEAQVFRTIRLNKTDLRAFISYADKQQEKVFQNYTSTSKSADVVNNIMQRKRVRINKNETDVLLVINGKTGHPINDFSMYNGKNGYENQQEILFDKGCKFRFYKWEQDSNDRFIFHLNQMA